MIDSGATTVATRTALRARKASQQDLPGLSQTLAAAFFSDPVFSWWIADEEARRQILPAFFKIATEANLPHEETYTEDHVVAGAVWVPPGAGEEGGEQLMNALAGVSGPFAPTLFASFELLEEQHPAEPHYYLFFLGTRPEWQGRGIGSALMRPVLETCDRDGVPAYLEATSERNRRLYLRHGFHVTGQIALPGGPTIWPMWREPQRQAPAPPL